MTSSSVLAHLVARFSVKPENLATEALGYILDKSHAARVALFDFSRQLGAECALPQFYVTQLANEDGSRPDIIGRNDDTLPSYFLEAKFWAGLTSHQPVSYLNALPEEKGFLLFVVPARRIETVWPELERRVQRKTPAHVSIAALPDDALGKRVRIGGKTMALTSWALLLHALRRAADDAGERDIAADIVQLQALCARMDAEAFIPLRDEELSGDQGTRILQYCDLADEATGILDKTGHISLKGLRATGGKGWYGRYMRFGKRMALLSYNSRRWSKRGGTPLWLDVWRAPGASAVNDADLLRRNGIAYFENKAKGFCSIPIYLQTGTERREVADDIIRQIKQAVAVLPSVGEAAAAESEGPPPPIPDSDYLSGADAE